MILTFLTYLVRDIYQVGSSPPRRTFKPLNAHLLVDYQKCSLTVLPNLDCFSTDVDSPSPLSPSGLGTSYSDPLQLSAQTLKSPQQSSSQFSVEYERSPIQNSPWKESSLDQPYQKASKPQSACSSRSRYESEV